MAVNNSGRVPEVVDLTIDSDSDSDDDAKAFTAMRSRAARVPLYSTSRPPHVSTPVARPSSSAPVPLPGSNSQGQPRWFVGARPENARSSVGTTTSANSSKSLAIISASARSNESGSKDADRSAKRRKLSTPGRQDGRRSNAPVKSQSYAAGEQPSKHGGTTQWHTNLGTKLITMNQAPSVSYTNPAHKPIGSSLPFVKHIATQAPRPLLVSCVPRDSGVTGLPSPGLTTPECMSAIVIDSDPLEEMETIPISSPVVEETVKPDSLERLGRAAANDDAHAYHEHEFTAAARVEPLPRPVLHSDRPALHSDRGRHVDYSEALIMRRQMPQATKQGPSTLASPLLAAPDRTNPPGRARLRYFSEEEVHLLIFLKEVKRLRWADITTEFDKDIKGRNYVTLQSHYSHIVNKRDRTQDPPTLNLPSRFASEARIDWKTVHANNAGSRVQTAVADVGFGKASQRNRNEVGRPRAGQQTKDRDDSSGTDTAPRRQRSRRTTRVVNYTWPNLRTTSTEGIAEEIEEENFVLGNNSDIDTSTRSESPNNEVLVASDPSSAAHTKLLVPNFDAEDALLGMATWRSLRDSQPRRMPYLSAPQRLAMRNGSGEWVWDQRSGASWQGVVSHVDFSRAELQTVKNVLAKTVQSTQQTRHNTYRRQLRATLRGLAEPRIHQLAHEIGRHLHSRDADSVRSFLEDAVAGKVSDMPQIQRFTMVKPNPQLSKAQDFSISTIVRQRELGGQCRRGWSTASAPLAYQTKNRMVDTLGPKFTWTGASSDIHTVAWSPLGEHFAAGAVAVTDQDSMQYNRRNNLLYGNTINRSIYELGEHSIDRPRTETGVNSTRAMYASQDPKLYTTVSSVAFSPSGRLMYSAGYDKRMCIWDVSERSLQPQLVTTLKHKAEVDILAVNQRSNGIIATASKRTTDNSIKLVRLDENAINDHDWRPSHSNLASAKAMSRPDLKMTANALQFDPTDGGLLLAGFGANLYEDGGLDTTGDVCLWDVEYETNLHVYGSSRNVFDVTFQSNPRRYGLFAVGCVASGNVNRGIRSVVRIYTTKGEKFNPDSKYTCPMEFECKAYDMNDVVWCPYDDNLLATGCTDGRAYVWDLRRPDKTLYTLIHGTSLMPLQDDMPHERTDTGVRYLSWGQNATRLYSGSSDGVVKVWNVTRSPEDTFVKDLITTDSGIMSGAFSSDYSKLLLGEVNGSVNMLEVGRDDITIRDAEKLEYNPYFSKEENSLHIDEPPLTDTAAADARWLLESGQLQLAPMGGLPKRQVIQGPYYKGPFDRGDDACTESLQHQTLVFQESMAVAKGPQCNLPGCADSINVITTFEEVGDSGRSADRIPDELRRQWFDESIRVVPGKSKCTHCSRPAFPSTDGGGATYCERCCFACLRCGGANNVAGLATTIACNLCGGVWSVGALGYECDQEPDKPGASLHVPALNNYKKEMYLERLEDRDTTLGDEMNALTDYYFGLAIDRPESPPL